MFGALLPEQNLPLEYFYSFRKILLVNNKERVIDGGRKFKIV